MNGDWKEAQELDGLLERASEEMRFSLLTALLSIPRINGLTCAIKPQGDFKSLGVRRDNQWFAAISVNNTSLKGFFEPVAKVDPEMIEREFGTPANRKDRVISIPIGTFDDMLRFISVLKTTV